MGEAQLESESGDHQQVVEPSEVVYMTDGVTGRRWTPVDAM